MGILLLVTAFNAVLFVGPFFNMLYDVFRWWIFHRKSSGKQYCSNICCSTIFDTDVDSESEREITPNNMENFEKEIKEFNNPSVNITSNVGDTWKRELGEFVDDVINVDNVDDYIMKSSSTSFASSNRLDRSLSSTSQDADITEKEESYNYHV